MTHSTIKTARRLAAPALALAATLSLAATPAMAGEDTPIEVTSHSEMKRWKSDVSKQLDRALVRAPGRVTAVPGSGIVQIAFTLGKDGRPDNLKIHSNSAGWMAERMAKHAVKRIDTIADAPVTDVSKARFLANIIFADDRAEHEELTRALAQSERTRLASGGESEDEVIVLGG
ncbi:MAG: hypothetical protein QNI87_06750 [Erythrobacter sp.]|uniref:hypothetical protein n=1 Tax=Erythrobacter sp. TaxID=1042 RepID=UPI002630224B|nr:hypothetical protein [Erythrobacter sp.]MDJ0978216.1 hypothetical protein [Erythrobacter sp.]